MGKKLYILLASIAALSTYAEIKMPRIFSDDMLLQREKPVKIWGIAEPKAQVGVEFAGQKKSATAAADGKWEVVLDPLSASTELREMVVSENGKPAKTFRDILVGEVWVLAGQSNMQMSYSWRWNMKRPAGNAAIRYFENNSNIVYATPQSDVDPTAKWRRAEGGAVQNFSIIGYEFARELNKDLNVPVGLVFTARGGTRMETWIPFEVMGKSEYLKKRRAEFDEKMVDWRKGGFEKAKAAYDERTAKYEEAVKKAKAEKKKIPQRAWWDSFPPTLESPMPYILNTPAVFWNAKVAPIAGYTARGFLWYQGESNQDDSAARFVEQFKILVDTWREKWGDARAEMPWLAVELVSYVDGKNWPLIRTAQRDGCKSVPNSKLVCTIDTGEQKDIHPADKRPISLRLERAAMASAYGDKSAVCDSPVAKSAKYEKGGAVVEFDTFGGKLVGSGEPRGFELKIGGKWVAAKPEIRSGASIFVASPDGSATPEGVRYAYKQWTKPEVWLFTDGGLPVFDFQIEK